MAVTEQSRHRLYGRLEEVLGREDANTMMEHLPPVGWSDVATKSDLAHLEASMRKEFDHAAERTDQRFDHAAEQTNQRFDHMEASLRGEITSVEASLRGEITSVEGRLRGEIKSEGHDVRRAVTEQGIALIADQRQWMKGMFLANYTFLGLVVAVNAMF